MGNNDFADQHQIGVAGEQNEVEVSPAVSEQAESEAAVDAGVAPAVDIEPDPNPLGVFAFVLAVVPTALYFLMLLTIAAGCAEQQRLNHPCYGGIAILPLMFFYFVFSFVPVIMGIIAAALKNRKREFAAAAILIPPASFFMSFVVLSFIH